VARDVAVRDPRVTVSSSTRVPPVRLNRGVARRILEELVDNALRFSPVGTPVRIRFTAGIDGVEARVIDGGPGIDPQEHERIFGPLEQLEELNVRVHQGAGMGLALARTAARAMGGDVRVDSSGPEGTTFLWTLRPRRLKREPAR
jgi:signal transduction histidine kinase